MRIAMPMKTGAGWPRPKHKAALPPITTPAVAACNADADEASGVLTDFRGDKSGLVSHQGDRMYRDNTVATAQRLRQAFQG